MSDRDLGFRADRIGWRSWQAERGFTRAVAPLRTEEEEARAGMGCARWLRPGPTAGRGWPGSSRGRRRANANEPIGPGAAWLCPPGEGRTRRPSRPGSRKAAAARRKARQPPLLRWSAWLTMSQRRTMMHLAQAALQRRHWDDHPVARHASPYRNRSRSVRGRSRSTGRGCTTGCAGQRPRSPSGRRQG